MIEIKSKEQDDLNELMLKYELAQNILCAEVENLYKEYQSRTQTNPVEHIKSRIKEIDSATKKLEKKGYQLSLENLQNHVHDMVGIRLVCTFIEDVYQMIDLIKDSDIFEIKEEKDYISNPKSSGYQSYHMNVSVPIHYQGDIEYIESEIQIRTASMDLWAGIEHKLKYKSNNDDNEVSDYIGRQMLYYSMQLRKFDEKMQELKALQDGNQNSKSESASAKVFQKKYGKR